MKLSELDRPPTDAIDEALEAVEAAASGGASLEPDVASSIVLAFGAEILALRATVARVRALRPQWGNLAAESGLGNNDSDFADTAAFEHCCEELDEALVDPRPTPKRKDH